MKANSKLLHILFIAGFYMVLAGAVAPFARGENNPALTPIGSITLMEVEGRLDHLTMDAQAGRLYVAALENHSVEVVDIPRRRRLRELTGINEPQGLLFVPEKNRLFICSRGDGTCRSFDATTFEEGPWIDVGRNADNIRFDATAKVMYVGSGGEPGKGLMTGFDMVSLLPVAQGGIAAEPHSPADFWLTRSRQADAKSEIEFPSHPESFQIDATSRRIFVNVPDEHQIAVLGISTNGITIITNWPVTIGNKNFPMALDAASSRLFIACRKPAQLAAYAVPGGSLLWSLPCVGDADDLFFDAKSQRVYVIGGEGFVDVFQFAAGAGAGEPKLLAHVPTAARARTGLLIPELQMLAVAKPHFTNGPAGILLFKLKP